MNLGAHSWIDPAPLAALHGQINTTIDEMLDKYRTALEGYKSALVASETSNRRQTDADVKWRKDATNALSMGISTQQIYETVGEADFMPNAYARAVSALACELALQYQETLRALLRTYSKEVEALGADAWV